jgi:hypothetical protein
MLRACLSRVRGTGEGTKPHTSHRSHTPHCMAKHTPDRAGCEWAVGTTRTACVRATLGARVRHGLFGYVTGFTLYEK